MGHKNLFRKNWDIDILKAFLSDFLGKRITIIKLCNTNGTKDTRDDKSHPLEVRVIIENEEEILF